MSLNKIFEEYDYTLNEIEINNLSNLKEEDILKYFDKYLDKPIFLIPLRKISNEISKNNWIKEVSLKSNFKNKIFIKLDEVQPIGVYFNEINYLLVDQNGKIIDFASESDLNKYTKFKGENSKEKFSFFYKLIPNSIYSLIEYAEYIENRRWNILLNNNILIKLPEKKIREAFSDFEDIYSKFTEEDKSKIITIDLRIDGRAIIKFKD